MLNQFANKWSVWQRKNFKHSWWEKFKQLLLFFTVFSLSSNLFFKFAIDQAYLKGLLVDYLIPKIYLFDCLLIINLLILLFNKKNLLKLKKIKIKLKKIDQLILLLFAIFLVRQFLHINLAAIIYLLRLVLMIIFLISIYLDQKKQLIVRKALFCSILWLSFLAYYQFFMQRSLAPYRFFGEPDLRHFALISRAQFFNQEKILPYASTAHPNILAGIISIFTMIVLDDKNKKPLISSLLLLNALVIIFLTQSASAFLAFCLFLIYSFIKHRSTNKQANTYLKVFNLSLITLFIFTPLIIKQLNLNLDKERLSISRRATLNSAAWAMFSDQTIFGVGLNNYLKEVENYSQNREIVRFIQPVHHGGLLLLSEGGLIALALLLLLAWKFRTQIAWSKLLILSPIFALDHYLITQAVGLASWLLIIAINWSRSRR